MLILIGLLLTLGWLALGLHYVWQFVGLESLTFLPPYEVGLIVAGLFGPVALLWCIVVTLRSPGRARRLEQQVEVLIEQIAMLRQETLSEAPATAPSEAAGGEAKLSLAGPSKEEKSGQDTSSGSTKKVEPELAGGSQAKQGAAAPSKEPAAPAAAEQPKETSTPSLASKPEAPKDAVAAARQERAENKPPSPRPSPLTDGLPPFKAGKDEPKDGELIYDILRRSVRDHLNDTAMDIAAVLSAREAYSEALTKLRQGGRGAFFELVAKDLKEGGESARARLDRLNAWPMLDSYKEDYGRLLAAAGGKDTKLGALIESSELGQLGAAVGSFVETAKTGPGQSAPTASGSAAGGSAAGGSAAGGSAASGAAANGSDKSAAQPTGASNAGAKAEPSATKEAQGKS